MILSLISLIVTALAFCNATSPKWLMNINNERRNHDDYVNHETYDGSSLLQQQKVTLFPPFCILVLKIKPH